MGILNWISENPATYIFSLIVVCVTVYSCVEAICRAFDK